MGPVQNERTVVIRNRYGLHARPAAEFVKKANEFGAEVWIRRDDLEVNGRSIMGVMMLAAECGTEVTIRTAGPDAAEALDALCYMVEKGFGEG
jgi:phosphocarrier protein HPr